MREHKFHDTTEPIAILALVLILLTVANHFLADAGKPDDSAQTEPSIALTDPSDQSVTRADATFDYNLVPEYDGNPSVELNGNVPYFDLDAVDYPTGYESYAELDSLGRCGTAEAVVGVETMPTEERGSIGMVKPSGWHTVRYDDLVDGNYLYNRCHLIGYQLTGENANERNLVTGTRAMNVEGMLPYENEIADYVEDTGNHVLYRVTPIFIGDELVCRGVLMEARSLEDNEIEFNVFAYNVQDGVVIDYATGESKRA